MMYIVYCMCCYSDVGMLFVTELAMLGPSFIYPKFNYI